MRMTNVFEKRGKELGTPNAEKFKRKKLYTKITLAPIFRDIFHDHGDETIFNNLKRSSNSGE